MKLTFLFICILCSMQIFGQDSIHFVLKNQYDATLKNASISINNDTTSLLSDENGSFTIFAKQTDSIVFKNEGYETKKILVKNIPAHHTIRVKKDFGWKDLLTPMFYIVNGGLWFLLFVVFAETGLFVGFFLPGDSLLFLAGIFAPTLVEQVLPSVGNEYIQLLILWVLISFVGILGNSVGYWFGKKVGPTMYHWKENILFKHKYLEQAHDFYEKHGAGAIIAARFIPIIRTFAPIVAGIVDMDKKKFTYYNIIGCIAWVFSMLVAGHFLQKWIFHQFHFDLREHLEVIVIGIVLVTTAPVLIKLLAPAKKKA